MAHPIKPLQKLTACAQVRPLSLALAMSLALFTAPLSAQTSEAESALTAPIATLQQLAHDGDAAAQTELGIAYRDGLGISKDPKRAYQLFVDAARQHDGIAQFHLGQAYFNGKITDRNLISAYIWLSQSAETNSPYQTEAIKLRDQVATQLSDEQRATALQLIQQLNELYLQP